ncbi:MAG TPA: serine hydrolase, partial [Longimicrobiales bacterium]
MTTAPSRRRRAVPDLLTAGFRLLLASPALLAACVPATAPVTRLQPVPALVRARPEEVGMAPGLDTRLDSILQAGVAAGAAPGAELVVGRYGRIIVLRGAGHLDTTATSPVPDEGTLWDLASLTKVVATTTAAMLLEQDGRLQIDSPVVKYLPEFSAPEKARITVRMLLEHRGGLEAGADLWRRYRGRAAYLEQINARPLAYTPGDSSIYSDWDYVLLGFIVERVSGQTLDRFTEERIFGPLGMRDTRFNPLGPVPATPLPPPPPRPLALPVPSVPANPAAPGNPPPTAGNVPAPTETPLPGTPANPAATPGAVAPPATPPDTDCTAALGHADPALLARIAPTEVSTEYRRMHLHGIVHDPNACALGGVSGHAGLFSSARDLAAFAQMLLNYGAYNGLALLRPEEVAVWTARQRPGSSRALGWDTPSGTSSSGHYADPRAFGHTGYTGTSIWIDPERGLFIVLLTNRVNPTSRNTRHEALRRAVADAVEEG